MNCKGCQAPIKLGAVVCEYCQTPVDLPSPFDQRGQTVGVQINSIDDTPMAIVISGIGNVFGDGNVVSTVVVAKK